MQDDQKENVLSQEYDSGAEDGLPGSHHGACTRPGKRRKERAFHDSGKVRFGGEVRGKGRGKVRSEGRDV